MHHSVRNKSDKRLKKFRILLPLCIVAAFLFLSPYIRLVFRHIIISSITTPADLNDTRPLSDTLTKKQAQEDIKAVFTTISKNHKIKDYDPASFKKVEETYHDTLSELYDGITVREEWILSSELTHTLLDAHSCVRLNLKDKEQYHYVGAVFHVEDDGTIWYKKDKENYLLKSVNGISACTIYKNASERMSYENIYYLSSILENQMSDAENMQLLGIPWQRKGVSICYEKNNENISELLPYKTYHEVSPKEIKPYNAEYDDKLSIAVFTMNEMNYTIDYRSFVKEFFNEVQSKKINHIIIDLRNNGGGDSICGEFFCKLLYKKFKGDTYVLTSHRTFSSAVLFTLSLHDGGLVTIVGEETGGSPNAYGEVRYYSMPNSHLMYRVTQKYFSASELWINADTIRPDVKVREEDALKKVKEIIKGLSHIST